MLFFSPLLCSAKHKARASPGGRHSPSFLDPSHNTKHLSTWERPVCALRPVEEAAALSRIPLRGWGPVRPSFPLSLGPPKKGIYYRNNSQGSRVEDYTVGPRVRAPRPAFGNAKLWPLSHAAPALGTGSARGDPSVTWGLRGAGEGSPLNNGQMSL